MYSVRRIADVDELDRIAPAYATACADEAVTAWAMAGHDFTDLFREWLAHALTEQEVVVAERDGVVVGVSTWMALESAEPLRQQAEALAEQARANPALRRMAAAVALPHPDVPHLYLASMAVVPESRGQGAGTAILRHRLTRADTERQPVYLEASTPLSAALYARHGFTPSGAPFALPDDGPLLHPLWRHPALTRVSHVQNT
ncbi:GNAT family N-acetyltransferase [Saccharothrix sp. NRRL B-16314]|uniref:GNAT family N-acetyltransferase n=1 Tax=Saccharothrix sp. NRRL B-16314 TaxID=1463825 RepID=UPI0005259902|nr:GNAT family N-acetyltransferase [Saccharothrix sp. NRRL B-16314]